MDLYRIQERKICRFTVVGLPSGGTVTIVGLKFGRPIQLTTVVCAECFKARLSKITTARERVKKRELALRKFVLLPLFILLAIAAVLAWGSYLFSHNDDYLPIVFVCTMLAAFTGIMCFLAGKSTAPDPIDALHSEIVANPAIEAVSGDSKTKVLFENALESSAQGDCLAFALGETILLLRNTKGAEVKVSGRFCGLSKN